MLGSFWVVVDRWAVFVITKVQNEPVACANLSLTNPYSASPSSAHAKVQFPSTGWLLSMQTLVRNHFSRSIVEGSSQDIVIL